MSFIFQIMPNIFAQFFTFNSKTAFVRIKILYDWLWCLTYFCRFYNEMGGGSSKTTVNYLISLIDRVHKIYEDTVWRDSVNGQGFSGMGFIIKKIVVHKKPTEVREGKKKQDIKYYRYVLKIVLKLSI